MYKSKNTSFFPSSDRFQFLRLIKSLRDLASERNDKRLAISADQCMGRLMTDCERCPLSRVFYQDYVNTQLPPQLALVRTETLKFDENAASPKLLIMGLISQAKEQAAAFDDVQYGEALRGCETLIKSGDSTCPLSWTSCEKIVDQNSGA